MPKKNTIVVTVPIPAGLLEHLKQTGARLWYNPTMKEWEVYQPAQAGQPPTAEVVASGRDLGALWGSVQSSASRLVKTQAAALPETPLDFGGQVLADDGDGAG